MQGKRHSHKELFTTEAPFASSFTHPTSLTFLHSNGFPLQSSDILGSCITGTTGRNANRTEGNLSVQLEETDRVSTHPVTGTGTSRSTISDRQTRTCPILSTPLLGSLLLDADKETYTALCTTGVSEVYATIPGSSCNSACVLLTNEQLSASLPVVEGDTLDMASKGDIDACVDVLEEVQFCNLVPVLPRTFAWYDLVHQVVPSTLYSVDDSGRHAPSLSQATAAGRHGGYAGVGEVISPARVLDVLRVSQRSHWLHLSLSDQPVPCADLFRRGEVARDTCGEFDFTNPSESSSMPFICEENVDNVIDSHLDTTTASDVNLHSSPSATLASICDLSLRPSGLNFREAQDLYLRQLIANWTTQHETWDRLRGTHGAVVEWGNGRLGYTSDTEGLFHEQRTRAERTFHLPPLPLETRRSHSWMRELKPPSAETPEARKGDAEAAGVGAFSDPAPVTHEFDTTSCPRLPPLTLRSAVLTQLSRLRCADAERATFMHPTHAPAADKRLQWGSHMWRCPSQWIVSASCGCCRCCRWEPLFAQVVLHAPHLQTYLDHLHMDSSVPAGGPSLDDRSEGLHTDVPAASSRRTSHHTSSKKANNLPSAYPAGAKDRRMNQEPLPAHSRKRARDGSDVLAGSTDNAPSNSETSPNLDSPLIGGAALSHFSLEDCMLDELVLVGLMPRGQPYQTRLLPLSTAHDVLLHVEVEELLLVYSEGVLPLVDPTSATVASGAMHDYTDPLRSGIHNRKIWTHAMQCTYRRALLQAQLKASARSSDAPFFFKPLPSVLCEAEEAEKCAREAILLSTPVPEVVRLVEGHVSAVEMAASLHAEQARCRVEDTLVAIIVEALRPILHRRLFTMYELLRLLSSKSLYIAHKELVERYRSWYGGTPSPGVVLRLLGRSTYMHQALHRAFPEYSPVNSIDRSLNAPEELQPTSVRTPHTMTCVVESNKRHGTPCLKRLPNGSSDGFDREVTSGDTSMLHEYLPNISDSRGGSERILCEMRDGVRDSDNGGPPKVDFFVPECALLDPKYLVRLTSWIRRHYRVGASNSHLMRADNWCAEVDEQRGPTGTSWRAAWQCRDGHGFRLMVHKLCSRREDPALYTMLRVMEKKSRTMHAVEIDQYIQTLVQRNH